MVQKKEKEENKMIGFLASFILIYILGHICHPIIKRLRPKHKGAVAWYSTLSIIIPLIIGIIVYIGCFNFLGINGKDLMFNTLFGFIRVANISPDTPGLDVIAAILFISYFFWYIAAKDFSRMMYGQRTYEGGFWWILKPVKKPKGYKKKST